MTQSGIMEIVDRVGARFPAWGDREKTALAGLVSALEEYGYLPNAPLEAALDQFLDTVGKAHLKAGPARGLIDNFFSMQTDHARRLFFKHGRKLLDPEVAEDIRLLFGEQLMIDLWPVANPDRAQPHEQSAPAALAVLDETDYQLFVVRHFGRDRTFLPDALALQGAIDAALEDLQQLSSGLPDHAQATLDERLEREFLSSLREMIAALERGENPPAFHFMA